MLWLILSVEALVVILIIVQMMRKRSSLRDEDEIDEQPADQTKPNVRIELPEEEKWE